jgi:DNA-directed RNA polymerase subunit beta'
MPSKLPGQATLSDSSGFVSKVSKDVSGGWNVHVGKDLMYVPAALSLKVKKGDKVRKGDPVSSGPINPHHLLKLTDMDRVQRYLADEIYGVYKSEGIQRRNIEVITRGLTNLAKVEDPGDAPGLIRGDYVQIANINAMNTKFKNKVQVTPMLKGLETLALDQTDNWLARLHYRKLKDTLRRGASEGWHSDIHGAHPIPGIAYSAEFGKNTNKGPY